MPALWVLFEGRLLHRRGMGGAARIDAGSRSLAATLLTRFFEMPFCADVAHGAFSIEFLFNTAQRFFNGFAFSYFHFSHMGVLTCLLLDFPAVSEGIAGRTFRLESRKT